MQQYYGSNSFRTKHFIRVGFFYFKLRAQSTTRSWTRKTCSTKCNENCVLLLWRRPNCEYCAFASNNVCVCVCEAITQVGYIRVMFRELTPAATPPRLASRGLFYMHTSARARTHTKYLSILICIINLWEYFCTSHSEIYNAIAQHEFCYIIYWLLCF